LLIDAGIVPVSEYHEQSIDVAAVAFPMQLGIVP
jgi:hypothetical protein